MKAAFTYAIKYHAAITCSSPLRTGSVNNDMQDILRSFDRTPILQGTSLAGAMRAYAETAGLDTERLFGSQKNEGELIISDIRFDHTENKAESRPRLKIDAASGTAENKFDITALPSGTKGTFDIVWKSNRPLINGREEVEALLAALDSGLIRLGAQRSNGYGRVRIDSVSCRTFDLTNAVERSEWLADWPADHAIRLPAAEACSSYVKFLVSGETSGILAMDGVGCGSGDNAIQHVNIADNGCPIIPASSIKGAIRARVEEIVRSLGLPSETTSDIFGCPASGRGEGSKAGKLRFSDGLFSGRKEARITRIRIDRFTGSVISGATLNEEPLSGTLSFFIEVPADDRRACALVLFALRDLGLGMFSLCSGRSIGRGRVSGLTVEASAGSKSIALNCRDDGSVELEDPGSLTETWLKALGGEQL